MLMSAELKECVTWFIYFSYLVWIRQNCAKFYHCRICVTVFREVGLFGPPPPPPHHHLRAAPKKPILKKVKGLLSYMLKIYDFSNFTKYMFDISTLMLDFYLIDYIQNSINQLKKICCHDFYMTKITLN